MKLNENDITPEELFINRRKFLKLGAASIVATSALIDLMAKENFPTPNLNFLKDNNPLNLKLTDYEQILSYNNFYEFTTDKEDVQYLARTLVPKPWIVEVDGLVEKPFQINADELIKKYSLEERIYRFRCVEGWSMVVPWIGFELGKFIKDCKVLSDAKYIRFETLWDDDMFPDQARGVFASIKYPYVEALRLDEAMNPLSLLAVGLYGRTLENQNGAPLRLVVPWKYGFKSIKSISRISFVSEEPMNTWQEMAPKEYGFYANVNPNVDHPRWSQKRERILGSIKKQNTMMFNGYEKEVAHLYKNMDLTKYF